MDFTIEKREAMRIKPSGVSYPYLYARSMTFPSAPRPPPEPFRAYYAPSEGICPSVYEPQSTGRIQIDGSGQFRAEKGMTSAAGYDIMNRKSRGGHGHHREHPETELYAADGQHASEAGSRLAAATIAEVYLGRELL